jgi:tetratricopeptide (TPR) repeat protein
VLLGRMILEGADDEALVDAAKAAAQRAPREAAGDDVTLVAAEIVWRRSGQPVLAEPYYRRVRRNDPARAEVLEFYRELFAGDKDAAQLMQVLVQARRASRDPAVRFALAEEMAALAQGRLGSADRAIESWRSVLREDGHDPRAVAHLQRLYRETGKWTALVELLKEELDAIEAAPTNTALRIEKLLEIARLYRDELRLDAMTLATLQRILEIDPGHEESLSALADTYVSTGRFNDLLGVYQRLIQAAASTSCCASPASGFTSWATRSAPSSPSARSSPPRRGTRPPASCSPRSTSSAATGGPSSPCAARSSPSAKASRRCRCGSNWRG